MHVAPMDIADIVLENMHTKEHTSDSQTKTKKNCVCFFLLVRHAIYRLDFVLHNILMVSIQQNTNFSVLVTFWAFYTVFVCMWVVYVCALFTSHFTLFCHSIFGMVWCFSILVYFLGRVVFIHQEFRRISRLCDCAYQNRNAGRIDCDCDCLWFVFVFILNGPHLAIRSKNHNEANMDRVERPQSHTFFFCWRCYCGQMNGINGFVIQNFPMNFWAINEKTANRRSTGNRSSKEQLHLARAHNTERYSRPQMHWLITFSCPILTYSFYFFPFVISECVSNFFLR